MDPDDNDQHLPPFSENNNDTSGNGNNTSRPSYLNNYDAWSTNLPPYQQPTPLFPRPQAQQLGSPFNVTYTSTQGQPTFPTTQGQPLASAFASPYTSTGSQGRPMSQNLGPLETPYYPSLDEQGRPISWYSRLQDPTYSDGRGQWPRTPNLQEQTNFENRSELQDTQNPHHSQQPEIPGHTQLEGGDPWNMWFNQFRPRSSLPPLPQSLRNSEQFDFEEVSDEEESDFEQNQDEEDDEDDEDYEEEEELVESPKKRKRRQTNKSQITNPKKTPRKTNANGSSRKPLANLDWNQACEKPVGGDTPQGGQKPENGKCLTCIKYERSCEGTLVKNGKCARCAGLRSQVRKCHWADKDKGIRTYQEAQNATNSRRIPQNTSAGVAARKAARNSPTLDRNPQDPTEALRRQRSLRRQAGRDQEAEEDQPTGSRTIRNRFSVTVNILNTHMERSNEEGAILILAAIHVARGDQARVLRLLRPLRQGATHPADMLQELQYLRADLQSRTVIGVQRQLSADERVTILQNALQLPPNRQEEVEFVRQMARLEVDSPDGEDTRFTPLWVFSALEYIIRNA